MDNRLKLFKYKAVYDHQGSDGLFIAALRDAVDHHTAHCPDYAALLRQQKFDIAQLESIEDIHNLPPIPMLFLKRNELNSMPPEDMIMRYTTSGTSGNPVTAGMDRACIRLGANMLWRMVRRHGLISPKPTRHIILGYQPSSHNQMGAVRTAYNSTWLALPVSRVFALEDTGDSYSLNMQGIHDALLKYAHGKMAVRLCGFPAYMLFLLQEMQRQGICLKLPRGSRVLLGGGWKQFISEMVDKRELYAMVERQLGIPESMITEFFGVVEHLIPYFDCCNHHFHVPVYSRVLIRDASTLEPLPYGQPGLLNLITPFLRSMPLISIMTDDVAVLNPGQKCGCGIEAPYFEVLGRAGLEGIKTCAANAEELL